MILHDGMYAIVSIFHKFERVVCAWGDSFLFLFSRCKISVISNVCINLPIFQTILPKDY